MHIRDGNGNFGINYGFINPNLIEVSDSKQKSGSGNKNTGDKC